MSAVITGRLGVLPRAIKRVTNSVYQIDTKLTQPEKKAQPEPAKPLYLKVELTGVEPVTS